MSERYMVEHIIEMYPLMGGIKHIENRGMPVKQKGYNHFMGYSGCRDFSK